MGFAEQIADLTKSVNGLVTTVKGQFSKWDNAVKAKENEVDAFISGASNHFPKVAIYHGRTLEDYNKNYNGIGTTELEQHVITNINWEDRTPLEREFLTTLGAENAKYIYMPFDILKITIPKGINGDFGRRKVIGNSTTFACVKWVSGELESAGWHYSWTAGAEKGVCKKCGSSNETNNYTDYSFSIGRVSNNNEEDLVMYVACRQEVSGIIPINSLGIPHIKSITN